MNIRLEYFRSVYKAEQMPPERYPEIVVCGRSNVGKSSLLNTISGGKVIAKVSSTPGKTESVNYFSTTGKFYLVDLPGFGYAQRDKATVATWGRLIDNYFRASGHIVEALHLIDSRHTGMESDLRLEEYFRGLGIPSYIVLTKSDKLSQSERSAAEKAIKINYPDVKVFQSYQFFSSKNSEGKDELIKEIMGKVK